MSKERILEGLDLLVPKKPKSGWSKEARNIANSAIEYINNSVTKEELEQAKKDIRELGWFDDDDNCIQFRQVYVSDVFDVLDKLIKGDNND